MYISFLSKYRLIVPLLVIGFCSLIHTQAQDIIQARKIIDTLSSPTFQGRGCLKSGDSLAAEFIQNAYQNIGLSSFATGYSQSFSYPINTFPVVKARCNKKNLQVGTDYITHPASQSIKGRFKIHSIDTALSYKNNLSHFVFKKNKSKTALVYTQSFAKRISTLPETVKKEIYNHPLHIRLDKKLTASLAGHVDNYTLLHMQVDSFPSTAKTLTVQLESNLIKHTSRNIIGYVPGTIHPDSFVVFSAHYDHLGTMGNVFFPGANDNASGVALLFQLATYFSHPSHRPKYSIVFIAFAGEEAGLQGSYYFTEHPIFPLSNISFLLNLDLVGSGKEGLTVVNGRVFTQKYDLLEAINEKKQYFPIVKARGKAQNSDHYYFTEKGVPSFFLYTLGEITAYHDVNDVAKNVTLSHFAQLYNLLIDFTESICH